MKNISFEEKFKNYLRASYPLLYIRTHEEIRVSRAIVGALINTKVPVDIYSWDSKRLLEKYDRSNNGSGGLTWVQVKNTTGKDFSLNNVIDSIKNIGSSTGRNVFILKDFHSYIEAPGQIRPIRNAIEELKSRGNMIVFVSPFIKIPVELEKEIQILDFHMPNDEQLEGILMSVANIYNKKNKEKERAEKILTPDIKQASIEAAKGLTFGEAHDAFSLSIIENHDFNNDFILSVFDEKVKQVKRNGLIQYIKPDITFDGIGGLEGLKKWIRARAKAYSIKAREYKLPYPKGMLLCGKL
jgi:hypothetical protein